MIRTVARRLLLRLANNLRLIAVLYIASLILAAGLLSVFEHRSFLDSLWWSVVTALTIGYGDIAPTTLPGRIVSVTFQHFWIFGIAPLIIANVVMRVMRDADQYSHEEQEWTMESIQKIADRLGVELRPQPADTNYED